MRHSVDFGFAVTVMTQVISCQQLILRSFPKPLLPHKCNLIRSVGVAVRSNSRIVRWEEVCLNQGHLLAFL